MSEENSGSLKALLFRLENLLDIGDWAYGRYYSDVIIERQLEEVSRDILNSPMYIIDYKIKTKIKNILNQNTNNSRILAANLIAGLKLEEQKLS